MQTYININKYIYYIYIYILQFFTHEMVTHDPPALHIPFRPEEPLSNTDENCEIGKNRPFSCLYIYISFLR